MSEDTNDNIYILEEENKESDNSPLNFAAYNSEEEKELDEKDIVTKEKSSFAILLYIMFNPVEGWKQIRRSIYNIESFQNGCFYPLLALLALSEFADLFYSVNINLSQIITKAIVNFVAFFFGYYCIQMVMSWFLPKEINQKVKSLYGSLFILVSLSTLVFFSILTNLLPMLWPILIFLPLWTFYLMFKGIRFFKLGNYYEMKFYILSVSAVVGVPLLIDWVLNTILPY